MTNSKTENTNKIVMTGWHILSRGLELNQHFSMLDCAPLDAPERIATGSTFKGSCYENILSSSYDRERGF